MNEGFTNFDIALLADQALQRVPSIFVDFRLSQPPGARHAINHLVKVGLCKAHLTSIYEKRTIYNAMHQVTSLDLYSIYSESHLLKVCLAGGDLLC